MFLLRSVGMLALAFIACAIVAWGWFAWLPVVAQVIEERGEAWGFAAFGVMLLLTVALAWAVWRLHDWLSRRQDPRGRAQADTLYCQRCGRQARVDESFCTGCGSTRFGVRRPAVVKS